jgi:hypothetical protein
MPIKEAIFESKGESERTRVCESEVTRRREKEELLPWAAALLPLQQLQQLCVRVGSRVEWM